MDLLVFDLDGTLLDNTSQISSFTAETLAKLSLNNIAYTVATGRTQYSGQSIIAGHGFVLPHIYSNGVITWDPQHKQLSLTNVLTPDEAAYIVDNSYAENIAPFVSTIDQYQHHTIFHPTPRTPVEQKLLDDFCQRPGLSVKPINTMGQDVQITNVSMIGDGSEIDRIQTKINQSTQLIAYSGPAIERNGLKWMDIHHREANKGSAVAQLADTLGASNIICFGDSDNDLSMFTMANESYAPSNAKEDIKAAASQVIGNHHEDGVAHYLQGRFNL